MALQTNNNGKVINHLAVRSVKSSKQRNFFIIFTIVLSVSLLMVMSLFTVGMEKKKERLVSNMQHVIYQQVTTKQINALADDERVDMLILNKSGQGMEVNNKLIQPVWYGVEAVKGNSTDVDAYILLDGTLPKEFNEIAVSKGYCEMVGVEPLPGSNITLSFLDGSTEEFVISGILDMEDKVSIYPILFSETYAMEGEQLKNVLCDAIVRIHGASSMSQSEFLEEIRDIATKSGIERKLVNENNYFLDTLSGGDRQAQQTVMIIILGIGILFVSILVIYSVFYLSVIGRIKQFGQLRTIGMTKKQIKKMITKEGLLLSAIGIPIGILCGSVIGYQIQKDGWDLKNTCMIAFIVMIADIITVLISIHKPAKIASLITPIEAAKFSGYTQKDKKQKTKQLQRKLTPVSLAKMSATRNRKKTILTMISLGVGGILFMIATTFIKSTSLDEYSRQLEYRFGEFIISLSYNAAQTSEHGITDLQMKDILNDELRAQIEEIDGVKEVISFGKAAMRWEAHGEMENDYVTGFAKEDIKEEYIEKGSYDYDKMVANHEIFIRNNDVLKEVFGWEFSLGDTVKISIFNGIEEIESEYSIAGFLNSKYGKENPISGWFLMPGDLLDQIAKDIDLTTEFVVSTEPEKQLEVESSLRELLDDKPLLSLYTLREQQEIDEGSFALLFGVILGLSIFIIGFSMINLVNTLITNVVTKKQEFAMLQSIGMTSKQLVKMIQVEGLILSFGNLLITVIIGTPLSYLLVYVMRYFDADYMHFHFPIWYFSGYVILILIVPILVSTFTLHNVKKQTLVERLRMTE